MFAEKPFELLIIQEEKIININQEKLKNNELRLRDFLVGNNFDLELNIKLKEYPKLKDLIFIH